MSTEVAREKYVGLLDQLEKDWRTNTVYKNATDLLDKGSQKISSDASSALGRISSVFASENDDEIEDYQKDLCYYSAQGDLEMVKYCLSVGIPLDYRDEKGRSGLHWAVDSDQMEIVEYFLSKGFDSNSQDQEGQTPLHYASVCDRLNAIKLLLRYGANPNLADNDGSTPQSISPHLFHRFSQ